MKIIYNGHVVTRDPKKPFIKNGAVAFDNGKIVKVGDFASIKNSYKDAKLIDANQKLIMPGFINTHEHIYSALARGLSIKNYSPHGLLDILNGLWWNLDSKLTNEFTRQSARAVFLDCIKNGVTTVFDHHASYGEIKNSLFEIEAVAKEFGVRACLCYEISDRGGKEKTKHAIEENINFIKHALADDTNMIAGMLGLHAQFTLSNETLESCAKQIPKGVGYHVHVAEGIEDLHDCLRKHGKRIIDRLMDFDILGEKTITAHCIYINEHEIELLKDTNTMVVHNPESNMGNACGCPPTMHIMHKGVLTGLGTDGFTQDMLESYKVANVLHKHNLCDPTASWVEVPTMLFENNPKIAQKYFKGEFGVLKENANADIIVVDYKARTPLDENNINSHILFGIQGRDVVTTIVNGKILMENRKLCNLDEDKILTEVESSAKKLWEKINN